MKSKILAIISFLFSVNTSENVECRRRVLSSVTYNSARASLILEEFNGRGY